ncbi:MAG: glycosyltransferase [Candidatus Saccharibacteria bacterium]
MIKEFFFYAIVIANMISLLHLGAFMIGANVYDILKFRENRGTTVKSAKRSRKPLVSVIVPAHNESVGIRRTLDSIRANTYKNIEIIIVDDGSVDDTANVVRKYIRALPGYRTASYLSRRGRSGHLYRSYTRAQVDNVKMTLVSQMNKGKGAAMNNGIANFAKGTYVMCLDADSILHPNAIENAVKYFDDPQVMGVAANVRVMGGNNWLALLQRFEHMIGYRSKKFFTLAKCEFIIGGVASTYRRDMITKLGLYDTDTQTEDIGLSLKLVANEGNRQHRLVYAADVVASTEGVQTYRALLKQRYRWKLGILQNLFKYRALFYSGEDHKYTRRLTVYRLPMAVFGELLLIAEPLLLGYIIYLSIDYHAYSILIGAYLTITAYILWTIWPDEHLTRQRKIQMSLFGLFMYLLFYAMDIVQIAAVIRCVKDYRKIVKPVHSTWVSPARSTQQAAITF